MSSWRFVLLTAALLLLGHTARADFGDALMFEAVDLAEAHPADQEEDVRSMESLLHWAIANSDHEELAKRAESVRHEEVVQELSAQLEERRARVKELRSFMDAQVTETQLIKEALAVLVRSNATTAERLVALQDLQPLVEPIDNANDLKPLGGIAPIVQHLLSSSDSRAGAGAGWSSAERAGLRSSAAFVIGSAASNNVRFQTDLMEAFPDVFERLIQLALDPVEEVGVKGMYALATMVRNLQQAHLAFVAAGGYGALEQLMLDEAASVRVKRKALALVLDLSQGTGEQPESAGHHTRARSTSHKGLLSATLQLLGTGDRDMVEKALETVLVMLQGADREEAAANLAHGSAGAKLMALEAQLRQEQQQQQEEDLYLVYLVELCEKARQLLVQGQQPPSGRRSRPDAGSQPSSEEQGQAAEDSQEGPARVLQLGHTEL